MQCISTLRAAFPSALILFSIATITVAGQAPALPAATPAASSDAVEGSALPLWAYPVLPPQPARTTTPRPPAVPTVTLHHVPGSSESYGKLNLFMVPDWFPHDHPPMPKPVAEGRRPDADACGYCHLPNGLGRPENESIAGLPKAYILAQVNDFKNGQRHSSEPRMVSVTNMISISKAVTADELEEAADYFSKLKLTKWIRVVETDTVPKTRIAGGMLAVDGEGTEAIGSRIIEVSEDLEQTELRNPRSGFIAYLPKGSLKAGEALVEAGNGETMACTTCHGPNLKGMGDIPGIAGRSPSQMARQLIDFRDGSRSGPGAVMMKLPVSKLTDDNILAITAYLASLEP